MSFLSAAIVEFGNYGYGYFAPAAGSTFDFMTVSGNVSGLSNVDFSFPGYDINVNQVTQAGSTTLQLEVVPEPEASMGLLAGVVATGLLAGHRNRRTGGLGA